MASLGHQKNMGSLMTLGIGGIFLGIVMITLLEEYVKYDVSKVSLSSYLNLTHQLLKSLGVKGKGIYIPPRDGFKEGRVFVPLLPNQQFSLPKMQDTLFVTSVDKEEEIGILFLPSGYELVKLFEEHIEGEIGSLTPELLEGELSGVLQELELAKGVIVRRDDDGYRVDIVGPRSREICDKYWDSMLCQQVGCALCSAVVLSLAMCTGKVLELKGVSKDKRGISLDLKEVRVPMENEG